MRENYDCYSLLIIIIEDEEGHAYLIEKNLRRAGIDNQIVHLKNGQEAMDFLSGNVVRGHQAADLHHILVLLDLNLPLYDGYSVLEKIRSSEEIKHVPVMILSSTTQEQEIRRCYRLGCSIFLNKPVDYKSFSEAILQLGSLLKVVKVNT
jgi:CheY-like chemotaxis protein